jgi:hypothetical protein
METEFITAFTSALQFSLSLARAVQSTLPHIIVNSFNSAFASERELKYPQFGRQKREFLQSPKWVVLCYCSVGTNCIIQSASQVVTEFDVINWNILQARINMKNAVTPFSLVE